MLACAYSYFSGVDQQDLGLFVREGTAFGGAPTSDGLNLVMVNWPTAMFPAVRSDIEGHFMRSLDMAPDFAARFEAGRREERWYGTAGVPNYFRKPCGEGWALVGDAGYCKDPMTAQGISDAFIDAESVTEAIDVGLSGRGSSIRSCLSTKRQETNVSARCEFTQQFASLEPPPEPMQQLFGALRANQNATNAFFLPSPARFRFPTSCLHRIWGASCRRLRRSTRVGQVLSDPPRRQGRNAIVRRSRDRAMQTR